MICSAVWVQSVGTPPTGACGVGAENGVGVVAAVSRAVPALKAAPS